MLIFFWVQKTPPPPPTPHTHSPRALNCSTCIVRLQTKQQKRLWYASGKFWHLTHAGGRGFFLACEDFGGRLFCFFLFRNQFLPTFIFKKWRSAQAHNITLYARVSPWWLNQLRRLWPNVPWLVACELVSRGGSQTMPRQHCQPISDFVGSRVYECLTCHLYFWQNDWGLLHAIAVANKKKQPKKKKRGGGDGGTDTE